MNRVLQRFIDWASRAPQGAEQFSPSGLIMLMRVQLGMTQAQLAKRCGMTQSHVANIELGKVDAQVGTLRRLMNALNCRLIVAPLPEKSVEDILRAQAEKAARIRVKRVTGTMALEKQRPDDALLEDLVRAETEKLLRARSSEIWEEA